MVKVLDNVNSHVNIQWRQLQKDGFLLNGNKQKFLYTPTESIKGPKVSIYELDSYTDPEGIKQELAPLGFNVKVMTNYIDRLKNPTSKINRVALNESSTTPNL